MIERLKSDHTILATGYFNLLVISNAEGSIGGNSRRAVILSPQISHTIWRKQPCECIDTQNPCEINSHGIWRLESTNSFMKVRILVRLTHIIILWRYEFLLLRILPLNQRSVHTKSFTFLVLHTRTATVSFLCFFANKSEFTRRIAGRMRLQ